MFSSNTSSAAGDANFVEDVFSTYLYTGNGSTQTINNGIDLAGKGGLVWIKQRSGSQDHTIFDTARGVNNYLRSNSTGAQNPGGTYTDLLTAFNTTGFSLGADASTAGFVNGSGSTYVSWTFREQPKFFDVVTYTGTGSNRTIAHNLGSVPGCIIVKRTDTATDWQVYHTSLGTNGVIKLNSTDAAATSLAMWNNTAPTSTVFSVGTPFAVNESGGTYVAYLFAHNAGGFGLTGTDNVISCGSFTTDGSGNASVTLGYEPQFVLYKRTNGLSNWFMLDNMRGWNQTGFNDLKANLSDAENAVSGNFAFPTATGFEFTNSGSLSASSTYIYIAIRRGPMRVPTDGTKVYKPLTRTGTAADVTVSSSPVRPDFVLSEFTSGSYGAIGAGVWDRLRGAGAALFTNTTQAEGNHSTSLSAFLNTSYTVGADGATNAINGPSQNYVNYAFTRAPGFFDEVCYTGTGVARAVAHNLTVVPELIILKARNIAYEWKVWSKSLGVDQALALNTSAAPDTNAAYWNSTTPTASVFSLGSAALTNLNSGTFVAYLFASCPGVSKVGSYTGTGTTLQINCGFTAGSRFVLIKRTDSTGDWYVWDSARGIVAGNDPYLLLNSSAAEVTSTDYIDTSSAGFEISSTAPAAINANGGSFIFFAVA